MNLIRPMLLGLALSMGWAAPAGEVAAPTLARIIRIIAAPGGGRVACQDAEVAAELGRLAIQIDPEGAVAWALKDKEVVQHVAAHRLVVCGQLSQIALGASIAVVSEGGYPVIYIKLAHAAASRAYRVPIPDAVLKSGKVIK